jgi:hypothetical protein
MSKLNLSDSLFEAATSIQGGYVNELPFQPFIQNGTSPIFEGVSSSFKMQLPQLGGYFGTTTKTNATLTISADDKNRPIVAEWQPPESLGYVTVYMSDLGTKKDWSENWYNEKEGKILITNILLNSFKQLESKVDTSGIIITRDDIERNGDKTTLSVTLNKRLRRAETLEDGTKSLAFHYQLEHWIPVLVLIISAALMGLCGILLKKFKWKWLNDYALPISMIGSMALAIPISILIKG